LEETKRFALTTLLLLGALLANFALTGLTFTSLTPDFLATRRTVITTPPNYEGTSVFKNNWRNENASLLQHPKLPELLPLPARKQYGAPNFENLLRKDGKLRELYQGSASCYKSRSEAEFALLIKLAYYGFSQAEVWKIMGDAKIGKWKEAPESYRKHSYKKALETAKK